MARSMMLSEFRVVLEAHSSNSLTEFRCLIDEENLLGKPTFTSRRKNFRHLVELCGGRYESGVILPV